ncbi:uncharacterized protein LOC143422132 [Xylocopa sonorina]|uniref:uncharacterized protein LOC143422132 n=1 Tax=Xylocopa sonorina TaxID=1818115 RepID=UPI00403B3511
MLKHILTGQPSSAGSRHQHNDYQASSGSLHGGHHHHHHQQDQLHHYNQSSNVRGPSSQGRGVDVYDSVVHQRPNVHQAATTPSSTHRHPLNHSQLSVNNLSQRLNHSHALNLSTLSTSKHSVNSVSPVAGGNNNNNNNVSTALGHTVVSQLPLHQDSRPKANGGFDISRLSRLPSQTTPSPAPAIQGTTVGVQLTGGGGSTAFPLNASWSSSLSRNHKDYEAGARETLTSLGLLCLVSLLLALLSLIFLLKISPLTVTPSSLISPEEYTIVYEVTLALCALALSLNLCCLLVCAIQFLFTVKLVKTSYQGHWSNKYLQKSSISRICAVGGFFISIPVFLTGMILYTFIQFHSTPAIVTSVFIGLGIVFCGCAMVHNVFVWQREKTNAVKALAREQCEAAVQLQRQQQLQQHQSQPQLQQQQQQQLRGPLTIHHAGCPTKVASVTSQPSASHATHGRAAQYQHYHHHHHHRHVSMSPPPLSLSSPAPIAATHNHLNASGHRNVVTPPDTPADRSPPSPGNKLNRSQHLPREASGSVSPGLPAATLDLSSAATTNSPHELSTLV